jgi:chromosome segregation ATPase
VSEQHPHPHHDERRTAVYQRLDALENAARATLDALTALRQDVTALEESDEGQDRQLAHHEERIASVEVTQATVQKNLDRLMAHFYGATGLGVVAGQVLQTIFSKGW